MALLLSAFVAVMAQQGTPQTDQKKQAEACCAMESCCCNGDSCPLKMRRKLAAVATVAAI
jgi:hypothetical protein